MTEKKLYTCDICKTDYANKADAQKCEKEHCKCAGITDFRIHAHQKYPHKIEVTFSDGTKHWYRQQLGELNKDLTEEKQMDKKEYEEIERKANELEHNASIKCLRTCNIINY